MTTMTWGEASVERWRPRRGAVVHGSVLAAVLAGAAALWATLALTAALLVTPMETMQRFERDGAWGITGALRQGSIVLVTAVRPDAWRGR